jgi:hypothetical protein
MLFSNYIYENNTKIAIEFYNDFRLLNVVDVTTSASVRPYVYSYSFQFLAETVLAVGLLSWCLYLRWDKFETTKKLILDFLVPRSLLVIVLMLLYDVLLSNDKWVIGTHSWALFTHTNYALIGKFVLLTCLSLALLGELLSTHLIKYALMLLLFGMLLLDTSHLLSLYICL